ncbi:tRNA (adenine(58)-N(1))-methyltransferase, mitochondrial [Heteronotia binoei]|uniref:tRNA (adenine(58)-N(1))-methyltransferase, mitochondrial n=1 Tax=Heteronotia binoei TaxID=13085 RepID=UPI00292F9174|nr:tRNA (adenine(58)-N(1))-methyltransferase, mitochondrial [Heteronotia binoei]
MMRFWRRWLGWLPLRRESWEAVRSQAKRRKQPPWDGERNTCSFQGTVSNIPGGRALEQQRQQRGTLCRANHAAALEAISYSDLNKRLFSSSAKNRGGDESEGQIKPPVSVPPVSQQTSAPLAENRRRRAWAKSLSPVERVSRLVPEEFLSEEIQAMRSSDAKESKQEACAREQEPSVFSRCVPQAQSQLDQGLAPEHLIGATSRNIPFQVGELILAEFRRRRHSEFKKLCRLTAGGVLSSSWGAIPFVEIIGKLPGQLFLTSTGQTFLIRRPSLEDYVLLMKRGPTISYPKDMNAMLLLMDISQGDVVLEAGSGSGALTLFLSRAVGPLGHVISYEIRKDHHKIAKTNYQNWRATWRIGHTVEWPDNVEFINEDISTAAEGLKMKTFDAVALDMVIPQNAVNEIVPNLKQGGVCVVYVSNITQVIELLEAIHISRSTVFCERIIEVMHRDWLIQPVTQRNGSTFQQMKSKGNMVDDPTCHNENDELSAEQTEDDEIIISDRPKPPYICRPHQWQMGHTVFLVKLRKLSPPRYKNSSR